MTKRAQNQEKKKTISAPVPEELDRKVRVKAAELGISKSEAIRRALSEWARAR